MNLTRGGCGTLNQSLVTPLRHNIKAAERIDTCEIDLSCGAGHGAHFFEVNSPAVMVETEAEPAVAHRLEVPADVTHQAFPLLLNPVEYINIFPYFYDIAW